MIEHVPDIIGWLSDIAKLIRVGGRLLLVVPDKRYTFDYLRDTSKLADLIDNWIRGCRRPTPGQIFDYNAHAAKVDKLAAWSGPLDAASLICYGTPASALELSVASHRDNAYLDSHCWVFTPASFLGICADLAELGLLHWKLAFFAETRRDDEDFGVVLERTARSESPADMAATFRLTIGRTTRPEPDLHAELARLHGELDDMRRSRSWRFTAPVRWVGAALRRAKRP